MKKPPQLGEASIYLTGRLPTLPHSCPCSTIGAEELNCRVRDGNGWVLLAMVTQKLGTFPKAIRSLTVAALFWSFGLNIDGLNGFSSSVHTWACVNSSILWSSR